MRYVKLYEYAGQPVAILGAPGPDGWHAIVWEEGAWRQASAHATAARILGKPIETQQFVATYAAAACALPHALEQGIAARVAR